MGSSQVCERSIFFPTMESPEPDRIHSSAPSSIAGAGPSTSRGHVHEQEEDAAMPANEQPENYVPNSQRRNREQEDPLLQPSSSVSYRLHLSILGEPFSYMREEVLSFLVIVVTFWLLVCTTLIVGIYRSVIIQLGPNCSRLIQINSFFVQSLKVEGIQDSKPGAMLYGFQEPPSLDVEVNWNQTHKVVVPSEFRQEWMYFLNKGSEMEIFYSTNSSSTLPLYLMIAQGRKSLDGWISDSSYQNTLLSWNVIHGNGNIQQRFSESSSYYIAAGNLNSEAVEVELKFTIKAFMYNSSQAFYGCLVGNHPCSFKLSLSGTSAAVLTSPGPVKECQGQWLLSSPYLTYVGSKIDWYVKLSYEPRWILYIVGLGVMIVLTLLAFRYCYFFPTSIENGHQAGDPESGRSPLLPPKDDESCSLGSSYESISQEEEDSEEWLKVTSLHGNPLTEGENFRRLCVICFDASRDCFFLPCGHSAVCFACATRIAEEAGFCPVCRRTMKKVKKIFTV